MERCNCVHINRDDPDDIRCERYHVNVFNDEQCCFDQLDRAKQICPGYKAPFEAPQVQGDRDRWHNPKLRNLPKQVIGEFNTMQRRAEMIQKQIERMEALQNKKIDVSAYVEPNPEKKYYNKILQRLVDKKEIYVEDDDYIYTAGFQTAWPEESPNMFFQYAYDLLNIRFKWWAMGYIDRLGELSLQRKAARTLYHALPNINGNQWACPGDYATPFHNKETTKLTKIRELANYASSPNLRENTDVTATYSVVAVAFQYCEVDIKREGEVETTRISRVWQEIAEKDSEYAYDAREKICNWCCAHEDRYIPRDRLRLPSGAEALEQTKRLLKVAAGDIDAVKTMKESLDENLIEKIASGSDRISQCATCCFDNWNPKKIERLNDFFEAEFDAEWEKAKPRRPSAQF